MAFLNRFFFYIILMAIGRRGVWEAGCQVLVKTASTEKRACEFSVKELKSDGWGLAHLQVELQERYLLSGRKWHLGDTVLPLAPLG